MRLAYIDESVTTTHCFVGAILVGDRSAGELARSLDEIAAQAQINFLPGAAKPPELHAHPMFHGKGEWQPLKNKVRARVSIYEKSMRAIGQQDVKIFVHGLDIAAHKSRYGKLANPVYDTCLFRMLERVDEFVNLKNEKVLIISDIVDHRNRLRSDLRKFKESGTIGYRPSKLAHIIDTMHFAPSDHSRLIQAIDLIVFLRNRMQSFPGADPREVVARERMWGTVAPLISHNLCQVP